jgi:hypothetical protein
MVGVQELAITNDDVTAPLWECVKATPLTVVSGITGVEQPVPCPILWKLIQIPNKNSRIVFMIT